MAEPTDAEIVADIDRLRDDPTRSMGERQVAATLALGSEVALGRLRVATMLDRIYDRLLDR